MFSLYVNLFKFTFRLFTRHLPRVWKHTILSQFLKAIEICILNPLCSILFCSSRWSKKILFPFFLQQTITSFKTVPQWRTELPSMGISGYCATTYISAKECKLQKMHFSRKPFSLYSHVKLAFVMIKIINVSQN